MSNSPTAVHIYDDAGDLKDDILTHRPALHYLGNIVMLEEDEINGLGLHFSLNKIKCLQKMHAAKNKNKLYGIGTKVAEKYIRPSR